MQVGVQFSNSLFSLTQLALELLFVGFKLSDECPMLPFKECSFSQSGFELFQVFCPEFRENLFPCRLLRFLDGLFQTFFSRNCRILEGAMECFLGLLLKLAQLSCYPLNFRAQCVQRYE